MTCPKCGDEKTNVTNTVAVKTIVWRQRKCSACGYSFATSEQEDEPIGITVAGLKERANDRSRS